MGGRWVVERTFAWATRFRRLVRDSERLPQTLADLHVIALVRIMLRQAVNYIAVHNSL
jgi:transposase